MGDAGRRRQLIARQGADFSSNDYLGLAGSSELNAAAAAAIARGVPVGAGGSRLLRGNCPAHEALEAFAAAHFRSEAALYFANGFAANGAIFASLPQRGDLVVYDVLIHASVHDGMRLGRAEFVAAQHNDVDSFAETIANWRQAGGTGRVWIAVESLYSMDGDRAPLDDLAALASHHEAFFLVDEAHATGVFGSAGRGLAAHLDGAENVITLRTCGKGLGTEGALVCGPQVLMDFLVNRGRSFIFSTAPSPLMAAVTMDAIRLAADDVRRMKLQTLVDHAVQRLKPWAVISGSQIMPVILGDDVQTMAAAGALQKAGFDVRGIRPPTVPEGTSRLRISLTLNVDKAKIDTLAEHLSDILGPR